jgi:glycosyltransferase involved in cell wall biosynthesis
VNSKLSIITVNLNNKNGLLRTINSVFRQTFTNYEYIIIDGCSKDGSVELIKEFDGRINYWISENDNGIYNAMNKGIKRARGEYCLFLNSGDILITNTILEDVIPQLNDISVIYGDGLIEKEDKTLENFTVPENLTLNYFYTSSLCHASTFIAKHLFDTFGLYNEQNKIVSDWEFFLKTIILNNISAKKVPYSIAIIKDGGISRDPTNINLLREEIDRVLDHYIPVAVKELLQSYNSLQGAINVLENENYKLQEELGLYKKNHFIKLLSKFMRL